MLESGGNDCENTLTDVIWISLLHRALSLHSCNAVQRHFPMKQRWRTRHRPRTLTQPRQMTSLSMQRGRGRRARQQRTLQVRVLGLRA